MSDSIPLIKVGLIFEIQIPYFCYEFFFEHIEKFSIDPKYFHKGNPKLVENGSFPQVYASLKCFDKNKNPLNEVSKCNNPKCRAEKEQKSYGIHKVEIIKEEKLVSVKMIMFCIPKHLNKESKWIRFEIIFINEEHEQLVAISELFRVHSRRAKNKHHSKNIKAHITFNFFEELTEADIASLSNEINENNNDNISEGNSSFSNGYADKQSLACDESSVNSPNNCKLLNSEGQKMEVDQNTPLENKRKVSEANESFSVVENKKRKLISASTSSPAFFSFAQVESNGKFTDFDFLEVDSNELPSTPDSEKVPEFGDEIEKFLNPDYFD